MTCISRDRTVAVEKLLSVILEQSLTDLEHALPGSLQVLRLAAAIPPDHSLALAGGTDQTDQSGGV